MFFHAHIVTSSAVPSLVTPTRELAVLPIVKLASMNNLSPPAFVSSCPKKTPKMLVIFCAEKKQQSDDSVIYLIFFSSRLPEKSCGSRTFLEFGVKMFYLNHEKSLSHRMVVNQPQVLRNILESPPISGVIIWNQPKHLHIFFWKNQKKSIKTTPATCSSSLIPPKMINFEMGSPWFFFGNGGFLHYMTRIFLPGKDWNLFWIITKCQES